MKHKLEKSYGLIIKEGKIFKKFDNFDVNKDHEFSDDLDIQYVTRDEFDSIELEDDKIPETLEHKRAISYAEKEKTGDLPENMLQNIDEIWKTLEYLELNGLKLPETASSIIENRRAVKNAHKKI